MRWLRSTTLGVSGGTVVAVLTAASAPGGRPVMPTPPAPVSDGVRAESIVIVDVDRLRGRAAAKADPTLAVRRNLFTFAAPPTAAEPTRAPQTPLEPNDHPAPEPSAPETLIGIASDGDGPHTAIVSASGQLHFVAVGDLLPGGARVSAVTADSIELRVEGQRPIVLALRK